MEPKIKEYNFPNKKRLKGRDSYQNLSNTNASGKLAKIVGIIGAIMFSISLVVALTSPKYDTVFIPMVIVAAIVACLSLVYHSSKEKIELDDALYFNPSEKARMRFINLILGGIFLGFSFLSLSGSGWKEEVILPLPSLEDFLF